MGVRIGVLTYAFSLRGLNAVLALLGVDEAPQRPLLVDGVDDGDRVQSQSPRQVGVDAAILWWGDLDRSVAGDLRLAFIHCLPGSLLAYSDCEVGILCP